MSHYRLPRRPPCALITVAEVRKQVEALGLPFDDALLLDCSLGWIQVEDGVVLGTTHFYRGDGEARGLRKLKKAAKDSALAACPEPQEEPSNER